MASKYRFLLIHAFTLSDEATYRPRPAGGGKEEMVYNYEDVAPTLEGVDWDIHQGARTTHGDWPVETKFEFVSVGINRLPIVRAACESGKYNAIVLLGGGDPGYYQAREIGRRYRIPITSNAHAQMHVAGMLGHKFSIIDISETHNAQMVELVHLYRMTDRCVSVRNMNFPLPKPHLPDDRPIEIEKQKALRGEPSAMLDAAVAESVAAIEEDGAEVLMLGCSGAFWLQPFLQKRLEEIGWEIPVLEGYRCAIEVAKMMVDLGVDASGLAFPGERPAKWRRKKII